MRTRITFTVCLFISYLNIYSQTEGEYQSTGYYNHPTAPRAIQTSKILTRVSDSIYITAVGDLGNGTLNLNIHKDNSVSFENSLTSTGIQITSTPDSVNNFNPITKKFILHYQFTLPTGTRYIREEMIRLLQFKQDDIDYVQTGPTEVKVVKGDSCKGAITIPSKVIHNTQEFKVTKIDNKAFLSNKSITDVVLPTSINFIGERAFGWCENLQSINIPDSVAFIGSEAFSTTGISSIFIPKNAIDIGFHLFYQCRNLPAINVNIENPNYKSVDGVLFSKSGYYLFEYPNGKQNKTYNIPLGTVKIYDRAFDGGNFYLENILIPEGVINSGRWAFMNLWNLKTLNIPSTLKSFNGALNNSTLLESIYLSEFNPYFRIIDGVLYTSKLDTLIKFPARLKISEFKTPNSVKYIESMAFEHASELSAIHLTATINNIGWTAFNKCENIVSVYSYSTTPIALNVTGLSSVGKNPATLFVPAGSKSLYENATEWKDFANILEMTTGIKQQNITDFKVYPNPGTDFIRISGVNELMEIEVYNLFGKLIKSYKLNSELNTIDIRTLPKGVYLIKGFPEGCVRTGRFVKE